jgi:hypothetical protein
MSHKKRAIAKKKKVTKYFKQTKEHCRIKDLVDVLCMNINDNWITLEELEEVYKQVKERFSK